MEKSETDISMDQTAKNESGKIHHQDAYVARSLCSLQANEGGCSADSKDIDDSADTNIGNCYSTVNHFSSFSGKLVATGIILFSRASYIIFVKVRPLH